MYTGSDGSHNTWTWFLYGLTLYDQLKIGMVRIFRTAQK